RRGRGWAPVAPGRRRAPPIGRGDHGGRHVVTRRPAGGAALVLVLWLIVLLTAVVGGYVLTARTGGLQGQVELRQLQGDAAARAGIEYAMWRLNHPDPALRWHPDGRAYPWQYGEAAAEVRITDESGRRDLNHAPQPLL